MKEQQIPWLSRFQKNVLQNRPIQHSKLGYLSFVHQGEPMVDITELREASPLGLFFYFDKRYLEQYGIV